MLSKSEIYLVKDGDSFHLESSSENGCSVIGSVIRESNDFPNDADYKLSLKNCLEIQFDFNVNDLVDDYFLQLDQEARIVYRRMIQEALSNICIKSIQIVSNNELIKDILNKRVKWKVNILFETDEPIRYVKRNIKRRLDNGDIIEWVCFWDNGWWGYDGVRCPNVIDWERLPILDNNGCIILTKSI